MEIKDVIRSLVQQCNIESISTKDLAKELAKLYDQIASAEADKAALESSKDDLLKRQDMLTKELETYKRTYVTPVDEIKAKEKDLSDKLFRFHIEKEYVKRELGIYRELVKTLTATHNPTESYSSSNGAYWSKAANVDKPFMPGDPFGEVK